MMMLAGGEFGHGLYIGTIQPERLNRPNKLIRVEGILQYPIQTALMGSAPVPRLPLPYGAVVRMPVLGKWHGEWARNEGEYLEMLEKALRQRIEITDGWERDMLTQRLGMDMTGIDKGYCTK